MLSRWSVSLERPDQNPNGSGGNEFDEKRRLPIANAMAPMPVTSPSR